MLDYTKVSKIYLVCGKTDLRKGIDGLAAIIQHQYQFDPYENALFLFCGGRLVSASSRIEQLTPINFEHFRSQTCSGDVSYGS